MTSSQPVPGVVGPFAGLDVPWLLRMRAESRRDHPFLIWAPFEAPARSWTYGEFHERVGALAAGLAKRGIKPGEYVLIHLDNCIEAVLAWFACVELGAIAVTTNTRSAAAEIEYFADHCGAVAAITQPAYAELISAHCRDLRWIAVISHDAGAAPAQGAPRGDSFESLFADSADRPRRAADPLAPCSVQYTSGTTSRPKAVLWTHANALWGAKINAAHRGPARRRRAPDLSAAVPHQRAGLFDAGDPVGRRNLRDPAALLGEPVLERGAGARLHLDLDDPVLHEGAAGARDSEEPQVPALGHRGQRAAAIRRRSASRSIGWWGMTETITHGIIGEVDQPNTPMSIGRAAPEYQIRIVEDDGIADRSRRHRQSADQGHSRPVAVRRVSAQRNGDAREL